MSTGKESEGNMWDQLLRLAESVEHTAISVATSASKVRANVKGACESSPKTADEDGPAADGFESKMSVYLNRILNNLSDADDALGSMK